MPSPVTVRRSRPKPFAVQILAGKSGLDMNNVTAVTLCVNSPAPCEWVATLSGKTATELTATQLVTVAACPPVGHYTVVPFLTVTGQEWPEEAESFNLMVQ